MKLLFVFAIPICGFGCLLYGLRGKSISRKGGRAGVLERAVTISSGFLLIAIGLGLWLLVFRSFPK
jgi:hypothetical protein